MSNQVFMIGWEYPPHNSGGLGVACQGLTQALADQGSQIYFSLPYQLSGSVKHMDVIDCSHPDWGKSLQQPPFLAYDGEVLPKNKANINHLDTHQLSSVPTSTLEKQVQQYGHQVQSQAQKNKSDYGVIHAHDWMSFPAGMKLKQQSGRPLVAQIHSTEYDRSPSGGSQFIEKTEYEGVQFADKVIAVSGYTRKILIDRYGLDPSKVEVVYNGISSLPQRKSISQESFVPNRPMIVFMGRLTGQKGPEYFLQLAAKVLKQVPEAIFVVAGSGDLYHELLFTTANQKLSGKILFSGFVRGKQKTKLLDRADVFVMPSLSEPFGLVAVEAAQRSTPVIISKKSGVAEVLPSSVAVDFWDIDKMTAEIIKLLGQKSYSQKIVKNQLHELQAITWKSAADKVKEIYQKI